MPGRESLGAAGERRAHFIARLEQERRERKTQALGIEGTNSQTERRNILRTAILSMSTNSKSELQRERDVLQRELTRWQTAFAMFQGTPEELASWAVKDAAENKELKKERDKIKQALELCAKMGI